MLTLVTWAIDLQLLLNDLRIISAASRLLSEGETARRSAHAVNAPYFTVQNALQDVIVSLVSLSTNGH